VITTPDEKKESDIRRIFPQLSDGEFEVLKCLDRLIADFEKDPKFKKDFMHALSQRGSIRVRITFVRSKEYPHRHEILELGFKRMEPGAPACNASACRAVQNIMTHLGNAAVEQANGDK
jgi:hypothetical protein